MAITISDIEQKEFLYKGPGYDPLDVDQYLDQICDEMSILQDYIKKLESDLEKAKQDAENAAKAVRPVQPEIVRATPVAAESPEPIAQSSTVLANILANAQKLADSAVADARKQADAIVKKAQDDAHNLLNDAREEKNTLEKEMETLRLTATDYKGKFLALLDKQKALLSDGASVFPKE